jgi:leucyl aminopeptidase
MIKSLELSSRISDKEDLVMILDQKSDLKTILGSGEESRSVYKKLETQSLVAINHHQRNIFFTKPKAVTDLDKKRENLRKAGCDICGLANKEKIKKLQLCSFTDHPEDLLALAEGLLLANYQFLKYKSDKKENSLSAVSLVSGNISKKTLSELYTLIEATCIARDLVNEPVIHLTAEKLSEEIKKLGKKAGFKVEVFNKAKIRSLNMGGLMNVNKGSSNPPTFNILEYKPAGAKNKQPYVLVGKGVVYDTGGLSLKPTESMVMMKCDMAGAAAVASAIYALAKNKVPIYVIGLIPATENSISANAITPGDVITMHNGKTVEVANTDAEGRLILGDALSYASRYKPKLVIDLATLTGAALRAIGQEGIVYMGNASPEIKMNFTKSGHQVYERLVELPLWEEYDKYIQSDIADIKNLGNEYAGAITAGKFLEHFVDYDWLHLDIAGMAFLNTPDSYRGKNGTGIGVRLLYHFLNKLA